MRAETMKRRNKKYKLYIYVRMIQIIFSKRSKNMKKEIETDLTSAPLREPIGSQISAERTRFPEM